MHKGRKNPDRRDDSPARPCHGIGVQRINTNEKHGSNDDKEPRHSPLFHFSERCQSLRGSFVVCLN